MALLWTLLHEAPECPSRGVLAKVAQRQAPMTGSGRHLTRLRVQWKRNRQQGRPRPAAGSRPVSSGADVVALTPRLSGVGVPLFAQWLVQHEGLTPVVARLQQAIQGYQQTHPDADFALLHHRERTLRRRFPALFFAPLLGIETRTACDPHEHPLPTLLGQGYHSATLSQFLGPLERIDAAEALIAVLLPSRSGQITSVEGHMIASGSRVPRPKGQSTMLGRIMAGSQAVIAHDDTGQALLVASYPPAMHLSQVIVANGHKGGTATGSVLFGIDRAVNAVAMARACDEQGWGWLCRLDDNEHQGLESLEATQVDRREDGTRV